MAGKIHNNQIEATMAVVGTVCVAMDGGEARAKGKMSGWRTMQGNQVAEEAMGGGGWTTQGDRAAEDATRGEGGQGEAIRRRRTQQEGRADDPSPSGGRGHNKRGGWTTQGNWVVNDTKRGEGRTPRTQCSGGRHNKRGVGQCEARSLR
jgi:hypothetical protein